MEEISSFPNLLCTLQVYFALSPTSAPLITRELSSVRDNSSPGIICTPSLVHVTDGAGTPLTGHRTLMVVFEAAVTLSPMFMVTGLPSPTGISFPDSGTSIVGLEGPLDITDNVYD